MAEQADALDLESSGVTRAGSIPVIRTKIFEITPKYWTIIDRNPHLNNRILILGGFLLKRNIDN